jgi:plastocyanin
MTPSEHGRRWRRWLLLCLAAVLGAAVVVMPALASSEGATVEAQTVSSGYPYNRWTPMSVNINSGGQVTITNPSASVPHGVKWTGGPGTPSCSGVPGATAGLGASGTSWSGTCTFAKAGEYTFECTVHHAEMTGKVVVNAAGETTVTSTPTSTPGYPPPPTGSGSGSGSGSVPGYETTIPQPPAGGSALALLAGSASSAVKVPVSQHGHDVRGSVAIAPAGAGARLEVDLFAHSAVLASAGHKALVRIGRLVVAHVRAGSVKFSVSLSRSARKALARRRRLAVTVHVALQSPSAKAVTLSRSVLLRP